MSLLSKRLKKRIGKTQIIISISVFCIFIIILFSFDFLSKKEQNKYSELTIDQIENISIYLDKEYLKFINDEREQVEYFFTKQEIVEFLSIVNDLKTYELNHPDIGDDYFNLRIKIKGERKTDNLFIYFESVKKLVIIKRHYGEYSTEEYTFFKKIFEKTKTKAP